MDAHMEEAGQQHLTLMCSTVAKQQQQIASMKKVINNLAVNQSGESIVHGAVQRETIGGQNIKFKIITSPIAIDNGDFLILNDEKKNRKKRRKRR